MNSIFGCNSCAVVVGQLSNFLSPTFSSTSSLRQLYSSGEGKKGGKVIINFLVCSSRLSTAAPLSQHCLATWTAKRFFLKIEFQLLNDWEPKKFFFLLQKLSNEWKDGCLWYRSNCEFSKILKRSLEFPARAEVHLLGCTFFTNLYKFA